MAARDEPPFDTPLWAIRSEEPIDLDQIHDLHRAAFPTEAEAELVDAIRSGARFVPELSLVAATEDGSILGHAMLSRVELVVEEDGEPPLDVLALAPVAVLPAHQRSGIGTSLVRAVLTRADERAEPLVVVVGAPEFYARFGFLPAAELGIRGPYDDAGPAFAVRPRAGVIDVPPGTLVYPQSFAAV